MSICSKERSIFVLVDEANNSVHGIVTHLAPPPPPPPPAAAGIQRWPPSQSRSRGRRRRSQGSGKSAITGKINCKVLDSHVSLFGVFARFL